MGATRGSRPTNQSRFADEKRRSALCRRPPHRFRCQFGLRRQDAPAGGSAAHPNARNFIIWSECRRTGNDYLARMARQFSKASQLLVSLQLPLSRHTYFHHARTPPRGAVPQQHAQALERMAARHTALAKSVTGDRVRETPGENRDCHLRHPPRRAIISGNTARHPLKKGRPPSGCHRSRGQEAGGRVSPARRGYRDLCA